MLISPDLMAIRRAYPRQRYPLGGYKPMDRATLRERLQSQRNLTQSAYAVFWCGLTALTLIILAVLL